jgi:hypothetical protein
MFVRALFNCRVLARVAARFAALAALAALTVALLLTGES